MADKKKRNTKPPRAKTITHPLQRFLGTFMRLERNRQRRTAQELSIALRLSPGYIKMLEAGSVPLNISLAHLFVKEMAARPDEAQVDMRVIQFPRLLRYLAGSHWLAAQLGANENKGTAKEVTLKAMENLKDEDPDFQHLYQLVQQFVELRNEAEEKDFLEMVAAKEVSDFLRSERYGAPRPDAKAVEKLLNDVKDYYALSTETKRQSFITGTVEPALERYIRNELHKKVSPVEVNEKILALRDLLSTPSMNVDLMLDLKEALIDRPFVHTTVIAAKWELKNWSKFRYSRGLYAKPDVIIDQKNLDLFQYWYLSDPRFEEVQFIFLKPSDSNETSEVLRSRFVDFLNKGRAKSGQVGPLTEDEKLKIRIVCLDDTQRSDPRIGTLLKPISDSGVQHDAYWSFETHRELPIGFVGVSGDNTDNIRNLELTDSIARSIVFDQLWGDVEPKS